jgi:hypothetical protein
MKKKSIHLLILLTVILINLSCTKDKEPQKQPKIEIDGKNLTACPEKATCQYLFAENTDLNIEPIIFKTGNYRVFWSEVQTPDMSAKLYIKAPMQGKDFSLGKTDILEERVKLIRACPACSMIPLKELDGYVKGINLTPDKPGDQAKWLLEIKLIVGADDESYVKDAIYIKQYFYPNFVYN